MKRDYCQPMAKKIDYAFDEQIVAVSVHEPQHFDDPYETDLVCTWGESMPMCNIVYNAPKARGLNNCQYQGDVPITLP